MHGDWLTLQLRTGLTSFVLVCITTTTPLDGAVAKITRVLELRSQDCGGPQTAAPSTAASYYYWILRPTASELATLLLDLECL
jgi:hypothetical protein